MASVPSRTPTQRAHELIILLHSPTLQEVNLWRELLPYVDWIGTPSFRRMALDLFPVEAIHKLKGIIDLMSMKSTALFHAKRGALKIGDEFVVRQVGEGKDIMSILSGCTCSPIDGRAEYANS